jgi:argininosuccinate lyase
MQPIWAKDADPPSADTETTASATDAAMLRFTVGDDYRWDRRLLPYDVRATRAHAWGLAQIGVLSDTELEAIGDALDSLLDDAEAGTVTVTPEDEDSHTVIERYLTKRLGDTGRKVHAGRSRNDQVLAALRLYLRDTLTVVGSAVHQAATALCDLAEAQAGVVLPGYTHTQRAMPSTVPLWALGYAETWADDLRALREARHQVNVSPLGSAAGYGVPHLDLPRAAVAERLGFRDVQTHATAVQLARGKHELGVAHACVQAAATANRLAADLVLFATAEFDFVDLPDAYCTGSSIMPQKKNPDVLELVRGRYHRLTSRMQELASVPANLSGGYHRDLQLTKGAVMTVVQETQDLFQALTPVLDGLSFNAEQTRAACTPALTATERALRQVADGVPFRTAYRAEAASDASDASNADVSPDALLAPYQTPGTPGNERPDLVRERLDEHRAWIAAVA